VIHDRAVCVVGAAEWARADRLKALYGHDREAGLSGQPRPKLGRWTTELDELLEGNTTKPFREQLR
jgi:hypothetical protein